MKLYDTKVAPNPRRARIFLAEKGISIPTEQVDIGAMQHKTAEYAAINPLDRKSTRLNSSHRSLSRMPSSA